ncbi:hypothetical protein ACVJMZ_001722 [Sinorhizobium medicae]
MSTAVGKRTSARTNATKLWTRPNLLRKKWVDHINRRRADDCRSHMTLSVNRLLDTNLFVELSVNFPFWLRNITVI